MSLWKSDIQSSYKDSWLFSLRRQDGLLSGWSLMGASAGATDTYRFLNRKFWIRDGGARKSDW